MVGPEKRYEEISFTTPEKWVKTTGTDGKRTYTASQADAAVTIRMPSGRIQEHVGCPVGFKLIVGNGDVEVVPL